MNKNKFARAVVSFVVTKAAFMAALYLIKKAANELNNRNAEAPSNENSESTEKNEDVAVGKNEKSNDKGEVSKKENAINEVKEKSKRTKTVPKGKVVSKRASKIARKTSDKE